MTENQRLILELEAQPRAQLDIEAILEYSERRWGRDQRLRYRQLLTDGMESLRMHPESGRARNEICTGCRSVVVGTHLVIYRTTARAVVVLRVLHGRQDIRRAFSDDE